MQESYAPPIRETPKVIWLLSLLDLTGVMFAFFILLFSMSTFEDVKTSAVRASLNSAFASIVPPNTEATTFTSTTGRFLGNDEFQGAITKLFSTALAVEKIEVVQPGSIMRVTVNADSLFLPATTTIREAYIPMVDRLIASLSGRPPGYHFDMEFVIGTAEESGLLPVGQTLQMARAGAFVRDMLARGVPPDTIAIGVRKGNPQQIVMWFYVRSADEVRSFYKQLLEPKDETAPAAAEGSNGG
jgi:flagellar motor protein MotB